jgi:hypothetical protein
MCDINQMNLPKRFSHSSNEYGAEPFVNTFFFPPKFILSGVKALLPCCGEATAAGK